MKEEFVQKWKSQVKKGTLSHIVLNILKGKELYGYELIEEIKLYTDIEIAEGTLYPLLNRLKKASMVSSKWVEQDSGIPRKYYKLTHEGKETLDEMNQYWIGLVKSITKISK